MRVQPGGADSITRLADKTGKTDLAGICKGKLNLGFFTKGPRMAIFWILTFRPLLL